MNSLLKFTLAAILAASLCVETTVSAAESLFAGYFDIKVGSGPGTEVCGKVNLRRNKDAYVSAVPAGYALAIASNPSDIFELVNERDSMGRLFGTLRVKPGRTVAAVPTNYSLTVTLTDGATTLATVPITIRALNQALYDGFLAYAKNHCLANDRLYGRIRYSDSVVAGLITELETNGGRFNGFSFYTTPISSFVNTVNTSPNLADQWQSAAQKIGALGYAYMKSPKYGPAGLPADHGRLKNALYLALNLYFDKFPLDPAGVIINGNPVAGDYGDGLFRLNLYGIVSHTDLSHQWVFTDPLTGPCVWLLQDLRTDAKGGNAAAVALNEKMLSFFQVSFGAVWYSYRQPNTIWGSLNKPEYLEGAFSDGNLGHRMRGWITLPAIWGDYNRPVSYLPYWYENYFTSYPGHLYMPGFTPQGVLEDLIFWTKFIHRKTHYFGQGGIHPDGTFTHHLFGGTNGVAMTDYGYGMLTSPLGCYSMLQHSGFNLGSQGQNVIAEHYLGVYNKMIYRGDLDYNMTGINADTDARDDVTYLAGDIGKLLATKQSTTSIVHEPELVNFRSALDSGTHQVAGNFPFWVADYLVHRQGGSNSDSNSFYFSAKMGNNRISTADAAFGLAYHSGSGVLLAKTVGQEYGVDVRGRMDWHTLPGLTEEWRTDPLPSAGFELATGGSPYSGMASDGTSGFAAMRYRPSAGGSYCTAQADKGFFFPGDEAIALGCNVARRTGKNGQGRPIVTTVDQTRWTSTLRWSVDGGPVYTLAPGTSVDQVLPLTGPTWLHQGSTGYLIFPEGQQPLYIRGGAAVVDTSPSSASSTQVIHLALGHGVNPQTSGLTRYCYVIVPNVTAAEMPAYLTTFQDQVEIVGDRNQAQGIYDHALGVIQIAFHTAATVTTSTGLQISADRPALVQLRRNDTQWEISVTDPTHDFQATHINLTLNAPLKPGIYPYMLPGVYPRPGEDVQVTDIPQGVAVAVKLSDPTDDARYDYQATLYAGAPIHVTVPAGPDLPGPVAHWNLDETDGSIATDTSGNGLHGTVEGANWSEGIIQGAATLDGVDDAITTPVPPISGNQFTLTGWIKRSGSQVNYAGIAFSRGTAVTGLRLVGNQLRYTWKGTGVDFSTGLTPPDGVWTFVALVVSPTTTTVYMDGGSGLLATTRNITAATASFNEALYLGRDPYNNSRYFKGMIDDIRVYNSALTPDAILNLSQAWRHQDVIP